MTPNNLQIPTDYYKYVEEVLEPADVHDANRVSAATATNGLFVIMVLILIVLHAFNLYLFLGTGMWPVIPLLIHLGISAVVAAIAYAQYRRGMDVQHLALLAIVSTLTGIFGAVGALFGFISTIFFRQRSHHFSEWYETIFPTDVISKPQTIYSKSLPFQTELPEWFWRLNKYHIKLSGVGRIGHPFQRVCRN